MNAKNTNSISNTTPLESFSSLTETTKYRVVLQSGVCLAETSNEVEVTVNDLPALDIGEDTSVCAQTQFVLNAGPNGAEYLWDNGSTSETIVVHSSGTYSVIVTDANNCIGYDTITVHTFPIPEPNIDVNDTSICSGDVITLTTDFGFETYSWTNTSSTTNQAIVQDENIYTVRVWDSNGCEGSDTVSVVVNNLPTLNLEDSVQLCFYKELFITAPQMNGVYNWNTGEISQEIQVTEPGRYWIDLVDENNCQNSDTITVYNGPNLTIDLGSDTTICLGDSIHLDAGDYLTEIWMSQDTATAIYASSELAYHVLAINDEGCFGRDTISVEVSSVPQVNIVQDDSLEICEHSDEEITLNIENDEGMEIYWDCGIDNPEATIFSEGRYIVSKTNQFLCVAYDTITILPYCKPVVLTMPNVITPNGDGINELHVPIETATDDINYILSRITEIKYTVHNRWGRLIHITEGNLPSWNGSHQKTGEEVASGTYYWLLHYKDDAGGSFTLNGFVELFR